MIVISVMIADILDTITGISETIVASITEAITGMAVIIVAMDTTTMTINSVIGTTRFSGMTIITIRLISTGVGDTRVVGTSGSITATTMIPTIAPMPSQSLLQAWPSEP